MSGMNNTVRSEIRLLATEYEIGEQSPLLLCPKCNGGQSNESSLTLNRTPEGTAFICYRASCGIRGFIPARGTALLTQEQRRPKERACNPFPADESPLPDAVIDVLLSKFPCLTEDTLSNEGVMFSMQRNRVLYPAFDCRGYRYAVQARAYPEVYKGEITRKAIMYFENRNVPVMHFPMAWRPEDYTILVEDQVSAMILCTSSLNSVSLMGTSISPEDINHLNNLGVRKVIVALDNDAVQKGIKIAKDMVLDFDVSVPLYLDKDPKNMTPTEMQAMHDRVQEILHA